VPDSASVRSIAPDDAGHIVELTTLFAREEQLLNRPPRHAERSPPWRDKLLPIHLQHIAHPYNGPNEIEVREHLMTSPPSFEGFLAELDGSVVGMVTFVSSYNSWFGPTLRIETLYVRDNARRGGIARQLIVRVADTAMERKCRRLEGSVIESNTTALKLYTRLGAAIDCDLRGFRWDFM
jgi:GNAT superfamily N-acetyltransferase